MTETLPAPDTSRFPTLTPEYLRTVDSSIPLGRIYRAAGAHPSEWNAFRWFGPTTSRFDHHNPPRGSSTDRGVMYLAPSLPDAHGRPMRALETALLECYRDARVVDTHSGAPHFVLFKAVRELRLLDLADSDWVTHAGGNAAISSGPRQAARPWARAIYDHYLGDDAVDGLIYTTSNRPAARTVVLWERATDALPDRPTFHEPLSFTGLRATLEEVAATNGLGLV